MRGGGADLEIRLEKASGLLIANIVRGRSARVGSKERISGISWENARQMQKNSQQKTAGGRKTDTGGGTRSNLCLARVSRKGKRNFSEVKPGQKRSLQQRGGNGCMRRKSSGLSQMPTLAIAALL